MLTSKMSSKRYVKAKYRCTMRGEWYEVKVAALLFLRSKNSDWVTRFQLATNVEGAGALDDIVYRVLTGRDPHTWRTAFVQLKHKDRTTLKVGSFSGPTGDFSLKKYLKSFNQIKTAKQDNSSVNESLFEGMFDDFRFVIYTNSKAGEALMKRKSSSDSFASEPVKKEELEELLQTNADHELIFRFTRDIDEEVFSLLEEVEESRGDVTDFLEKLTVFTGQPTESELDDVIKKELSIACGGVVTDCGPVYRVFEGLFKQWWRDGDYILDETSDILQRAIDHFSSETELMKQTEQLTLELNFDQRIWESVNMSVFDGVSLLIVVTSGVSLRLSATRVLSFLQYEKLSSTLIGVEYLVQNQRALMADWRDGYKDCLVVVADCPQDINSKTNLCMPILEVLQGNPNKKAIIVSRPICHIANYLKERVDGTKFKVMYYSFSFTDLDEATIANIFTKVVSFQGHKITLRSLYDGDLNVWESLITENLVELLISNHLIEIGVSLPGIPQHVLPRKLKRNMGFSEDQSETLSDVFGLLCERGEHLLDFVHANVNAITTSNLQSSTKQSIIRATSRSRGLTLDFPSTSLDYHDVCHEQAIMSLVPVKSDKLECVKSYKKIPPKKHFTDSSRGEIIDAESVLYTDDNVILVLAEPGMGKSTLLLTLAQTAKKANPSDWVIYINLRDHCEMFNQSEQPSAFDFFEAALGIESALERAFLSESLEQTGNIVVFLDSFDEICPRYVEEGGSLLTSILKTKFKKLVVTSRQNTKHILEENLLTIAYNLIEFSDEDQKKCLINFWSQSSTTMTNSQLSDFVTQLIQFVNATDPDRRLMGIPLQTMMLAEVFQTPMMEQDRKEFFEKVNVFNLFEQLVDKKFMIFFRKGNTFLNKDDSKKKFCEDHMFAALTLFVSDEGIHNLVSDRNIVKTAHEFLRNIEEAKDNSGLIVSVVRQKPNFLHQMFAEFFAALWFSGNYLSNREFLKEHLFLPEFSVIRNMFDHILARGHKLHEAVLENNMPLVEKLLSVDSIDVNSIDHGGRTALHLAAATECHLNPDDVHYASNHRFVGPRPRHMVELLLENGASVKVTDAVLQWTPIEYAFVINAWSAMEYLLASKANHSVLDLTNWCIKNVDMMKIIFRNRYINLFSMLLDRGLPVTFIPYQFRFTSIGGDIIGVQPFLHIASSYGNLEFVELLLSRGADKYGRDADDSVALHFASLCGHIHVVRVLVESSSHVTFSTFWNTSYKFNWFRKYVNCTNSRGQSALHGAMTADVASALISYGADIWIGDYQKRLCLHTASRLGKLSVVKAIVESLGQNRRAIDKLIKTKDIKGKTAISLATQHGHSDIERFLVSQT